MTIESRYLRGFQKLNPPSFEGGKIDPVAAEAWFKAIETIFRYMNCSAEYQVHCATFMLNGDTHFWWKTPHKTFNPGEGLVLWEQFREAFLLKYYPVVSDIQNSTAFLLLKQEDRSVEDYDIDSTSWHVLLLNL